MKKKEKSLFSNKIKSIPDINFEEGQIPDEKSPENSTSTTDMYNSLIKSKLALDQTDKNKLFHSISVPKISKNLPPSSFDSKPPLKKPLLPKDQTIPKNETLNKPFFEKSEKMAENKTQQIRSKNQALNLKNEKFVEASMNEIKKKIDDNLIDFEKKLGHEISIISFLEDCFPILDNMRSNQKNELFSVFGFILSKYLYSRLGFFKFSLEKQENFLSVDNWDIVKINALLGKKMEHFSKKQLKFEENMIIFSEELKDYQTKDSKLKIYLTKEHDFSEDKERIYKKSFLTLFMGISEYLEKGKKHGASKYCYAFILRMYYFLYIYHLLGFFQMDLSHKLEVKDFQENLIRFNVEELKNEIIKTFKGMC